MTSFPYGASYSPLVYPEAAWGDDLRQMQAAGMNLLRIGDVHGSWDRIEPRPGELEIGLLGRFYQVANQYEMDILLSTGASSPPLWLARKYPDVSILSSRGERYPLGASYHWACIHHPGYREAAQNYLKALTQFAVQQPNHFGWQISNEIGFPFMPAREHNDLGLYCYCTYCQSQFRQWLEIRYTSLEALTHAWSWSTTSFVYNTWEDIFAPESLPASWSGVTRWIDWRLFWMEAFANFAGWQHQLIRAIDPNHPTSVNTFNFKGFDRFGVFMGLDQWQIAHQVDHIGYDLYPGSGNKRKTRPEHNSIFLDHGRSVAESVGRDFWIHETESGPIGGWLLGPETDTQAVDLLNNGIECLGHGAKLILYMPYREWGYQPIHWGALVELDGKKTPRLEAAAKLGKFIARESQFLRVAFPPAAQVAIVESKPNAIFLRGVEQEEALFSAQRGAYRAFWERGFSVNFITAHQLESTRLDRYSYIALPLVGLMNRAQARLLEDYVLGGGILLGFARCASLDEQGWYQPRLPAEGIGTAFGIKHIRPSDSSQLAIDYRGKQLRGWMNRDILEPVASCEVVADFKDGHPAVTFHRHGQGMGVYLATQADAGHLHESPSLLGEVINELVKRTNITPQMWLNSSLNRADGIDPHLLDTPQRSLLLFSNYARQDQSTTFFLRCTNRFPNRVHQLFPESSTQESTFSSDILELPLRFSSQEVKIIEILWTGPTSSQ